MKIINIHAHLHDDQDIDERVAHYISEGVVRTCLIGRDNVRLAMEKYPKFVIGLGMVLPGIDGASIVDRYHDWGMAGCKFIAPRAPYDSDAYMPFYEKMEAYGMLAAFHTGFVSDFGLDTSTRWMHPMTLDRIARRFHNLRIIGYHLGNPWYVDACSLVLTFPNIYFDLTGGAVRACPLSYLRHVFSPSGRSRSFPPVSTGTPSSTRASTWGSSASSATARTTPRPST